MAKDYIDPEVYDRPKTQWNTKKFRLLLKYLFRCFYCGCELKVSTTQLEHVIPRIRGGAGGVKSGNIVPACFSCNMKKGVKTLEEFRIKLFGRKNPGQFYFEKVKSDGKEVH